jgi:ABC-2 type transport system ATP-binding protein
MPVLEGLGVASIKRLSDHVTCQPGELPPELVNAALVTAGVPVRELVVERPALEELFVELTGEGFDGIR